MSLKTVVNQELFRMMARQLDYAPNADDLAFTVQVMVDDLFRRGLHDYDADRVRMAFITLGPNITRWPTSKVVIEALPPRPALPSQECIRDMSNVVNRRFGEKLREVNMSVSDYQASHPGATKREACLDYLRLCGLYGMLPDNLKRESENEAKIEREAIQQEGNNHALAN